MAREKDTGTDGDAATAVDTAEQQRPSEDEKISTRTKSSSSTSSSCSYYLASYCLARGMGILYVIAFVSLWVQVHGLVGSSGISPLQLHLENARTALPLWEAMLQYPTLFWVDASDAALSVACAVGALCGTLLAVDVLPALSSAVCWVMYLSLCVAGQEFTTHQADHLLLESGFLIILLVARPRRVAASDAYKSLAERLGAVFAPFSCNPFAYSPSTIALWMLRYLLFRSNVMRGLQQLLGGDPTWRNLTAFVYGLESQPSPTAIAWFFHQLPSVVLQGMLFWVLTVEVGLGCLCFGTRMFRRSAALYIALLHVFYILIGNFGTYHWNALLLCITLLDDQLFPRVTRMLRRVLARVARSATGKGDPSTRGKTRFSSNTSGHVWHTRVTAVVALALVILSIVPISVVTHQFVPAPAVVVDMYRVTYPFKIVNIYGPFHRVHKERQELIVQGSSDAQHWHDYDNRYKPDRFVKRMPAFVSPHISRVEHRLWQAAYSEYQHELWISRLLHRLLEGSQSVSQLFKHHPRSDELEYMRAVRYVYWFSDERDTGAYWSREFSDIFTPSFSQTVHAMSDRRQTMRHRLAMHGAGG